MAVESRREAKESRRIRMEAGETGKAKLSKPRGGLKADGKLTNSTRSNSGHNRMGPQGGEVTQEIQYMDKAKMVGNYRNYRKKVQTGTTVGERDLDERESGS
jgi:hypothetical protein